MDEVTVNLSYTRKAHLRIKIIKILKYVNIQADNYLESVWSSHSNLPALARLNGSLTRHFGNPRVVNRNAVRWVAFPSLRTSSLPKAKLWGGQYFLVIIQFLCYKYNNLVVDYLHTSYVVGEDLNMFIFVYSLSKIHPIQSVFRKHRIIPWKTTHRMFYDRFSSVFLLRFNASSATLLRKDLKGLCLLK